MASQASNYARDVVKNPPYHMCSRSSLRIQHVATGKLGAQVCNEGEGRFGGSSARRNGGWVQKVCAGHKTRDKMSGGACEPDKDVHKKETMTATCDLRDVGRSTDARRVRRKRVCIELCVEGDVEGDVEGGRAVMLRVQWVRTARAKFKVPYCCRYDGLRCQVAWIFWSRGVVGSG